mmetsp:Transcript_2140/g.3752  ORF Transcript_2140/g.3752 Transcript_2140/m.3752 type:complete len:90 (+) Transcript_2140:98-367(+)
MASSNTNPRYKSATLFSMGVMAERFIRNIGSQLSFAALEEFNETKSWEDTEAWPNNASSCPRRKICIDCVQDMEFRGLCAIFWVTLVDE